MSSYQETIQGFPSPKALVQVRPLPPPLGATKTPLFTIRSLLQARAHLGLGATVTKQEGLRTFQNL